jgi:26S proteasome regulatory subunit N2
MTVVGPYLPAPDGTPSSSVYSEGGSLFALGLIHANHGHEVVNFLRGTLKSPDETIQHGAALGLGVAAMATGNEGTFSASALSPGCAC